MSGKDQDTESRIDALYAAPLDQFVAARKALADDLKRAGKKDAAARVMALPKPNVVAAAVNRWHAEHARDALKLADAGARVRKAFRATLSASASDGATLASALARAQKAQREKIAEAVAAIRADADKAGASISAAMVGKLEATLHAISTTGRFGDGPAGRLVRELEPPGLEMLADLPDEDGAGLDEDAENEGEPTSVAAPEAPKKDDGAALAKKEAEREAIRVELEEIAAEKDALTAKDADLAADEKRVSKALEDVHTELRKERALRDQLRNTLTEVEATLARLDRRVEEEERAVRAVRAKRENNRAHREELRARAAELEAKKKKI